MAYRQPSFALRCFVTSDNGSRSTDGGKRDFKIPSLQVYQDLPYQAILWRGKE